MPRPGNNNSNKRRPQKRGGRRRQSSNLPEGLPADVEEYGEDLAALKEADGEEINIGHLQKKDIAELNALAKEMEVENFGTMRKHEMIFQILRKHAENKGVLIADGVLEILPEGFGFLRSPHYNYLPCPEDVYVSPSQIRRFDLQTGDQIQGRIRPPKEKEKFFALLMVDKVGGEDPEKAKDKIHFDNLTPLFPEERFLLETDPEEYSTRVLDIVCPLVKGRVASLWLRRVRGRRF